MRFPMPNPTGKPQSLGVSRETLLHQSIRRTRTTVYVLRQMTDLVRPKAVQMAADIEAAGVKELGQEDLTLTQEIGLDDRFSQLPHDILLSILERLQLREAARTSVLSRRWRHLFGFGSRVIIDVGDFHCKDQHGSVFGSVDLAKRNASVVQATKSMLVRTSQYPISLLQIRFHLVEETIDVIRSVDSALANRKIDVVHFLMLPEGWGRKRTEEDLVTNGRRFKMFFDAGPRAFASLSYLHIHRIRLSIDDVASVLNTCKKLEKLCLDSCDFGSRSVLQIEHLHLTRLAFAHCSFGRVELNWLPRLKRFTCRTWMLSQDQYPLFLGYVPQLMTLILSNPASTLHKTFRLSEFLGTATIGELDLNFECERIWIQPEAPKVLGHLLQNLQILGLQCVHEECDLDWTMFFLEAAPLLQKIFIKVWDHTCYDLEEDEREELEEAWQQIYQKGSNLLTWEKPANLKHYNLKEIKIKGYQVKEKFTRYIRHVVEVAENLERIILLHSGSCQYCQFSPSTKYPRTQEERYDIRRQISEWRSSHIKIGFEI